MKKYLVIKDYKEYKEAIKLNEKLEVILVAEGEKERKTLADVIRETHRNEEIEIDSIENAFTSIKEIREVLDLAIDKGIIIRTKDGIFSTEDVEDVPAIRYLLKSIIKITSNDKKKTSQRYPKGFLEIVKGYMNKSISEIEAVRELEIQRAHFYRLIKAFGVNRRKQE